MAQAAAGAGLKQLARAQNVMGAVNHCPTRSTPGDGDCLLHSLLEEIRRLEATGLHIPPAFPTTTPTLRRALIAIIRNGPTQFWMRRSDGWTNCYVGGSDAWIQHDATDGIWCTDLFLHLFKLLLLEHGVGQVRLCNLHVQHAVPQWQENLTPDVTAHLSDGARYTGYSEKFRPYRVLSVDDNWAEAKADILPEAVEVCNIDPMVHWCSVSPCDANPTSNLLISRVGMLPQIFQTARGTPGIQRNFAPIGFYWLMTTGLKRRLTFFLSCGSLQH